ncbi:hypothetical protein AAVH_32689, partial [Aphelenchoides avenae]
LANVFVYLFMLPELRPTRLVDSRSSTREKSTSLAHATVSPQTITMISQSAKRPSVAITPVGILRK